MAHELPARGPLAGGTRKVTYTLPDRLVDELDRRAAQRRRSKSGVVAAALEAYFAALDRETLATVYRDAAQDPLFVADNASVAADYAALDAECGRRE